MFRSKKRRAGKLKPEDYDFTSNNNTNKFVGASSHQPQDSSGPTAVTQIMPTEWNKSKSSMFGPLRSKSFRSRESNRLDSSGPRYHSGHFQREEEEEEEEVSDQLSILEERMRECGFLGELPRTYHDSLVGKHIEVPPYPSQRNDDLSSMTRSL